MKTRSPIIGVTPWYDYEKQLTYIKPGYCEGVIKAGGLPVLLPVISEESLLSEAFDCIDGILLSGGPDVDAKYFGESNLPCNGNISPYRDWAELYLARRAIKEDKPVLGICRGIQILNVAMGGSLYQDINTQIKEAGLIKHFQDAPKWYPIHEIMIEKGSKVFQAFGKDRAGVNSFHHQAVKKLAAGFSISSKSSDGVVEAIEYSGNRFTVGVQWHPELMWQEDDFHLNLFSDFVKSCILKK